MLDKGRTPAWKKMPFAKIGKMSSKKAIKIYNYTYKLRINFTQKLS